jgi:hypothetical protein
MFNNFLIFNEALNEASSTTFSQQIIPSWNTAGRPKNAKVGTLGFNFQTKSLEYWNGNEWLKLPMKKI